MPTNHFSPLLGPCLASYQVYPPSAVSLPSPSFTSSLSLPSSVYVSTLFFESASPNRRLNKDYTPGGTGPKFQSGAHPTDATSSFIYKKKNRKPWTGPYLHVHGWTELTKTTRTQIHSYSHNVVFSNRLTGEIIRMLIKTGWFKLLLLSSILLISFTQAHYEENN